MAECRVIKNKNFTVMSNVHLQDKRLSLKAVGLLSKMLSLPPDWNYTIRGLSHICREGRDAIQSAVEELEEAGYITRRQLHTEGGKFGACEYVIYEVPQSRLPTPLPGFPATVNPATENPPQQNTKLLNTYITPPIVPPTGEDVNAPQKRKRERNRGAKLSPDWSPERFAKLWEFYPLGKSKQAAIKAWDRLKPSEDEINAMALALMRQTQSDEWQRGIGIPYLSTWINQRRWEDEDRAPVAPTQPQHYQEEVPVL